MADGTTTTTYPASNLVSSPFIGISKLHVAPLLTDVAGAAPTYSPMIDLGKLLRKIDIKPKNNSTDLYADDQSIDTAANMSYCDLTFDIATLPLEYKAMLLGHKIDAGVMVVNKDDVAPYFGIAFQCNKRNGKRRFYKFTKVQFSEPNESPETKAESLKYNTPTIDGKAIFPMGDGNIYKSADEEATGFVADTATSWYTTF